MWNNCITELFNVQKQYNICSFHETYSVSFVDDSSERFSSLERLKIHVGAQGCAIEELILKFNFLIVLPKINRPQEYVITIKLASRVAKIENMRKQMGSMPFDVPLHQFEGAKTAAFSIEYVDSTVAAAMMTVIKNWFNNLETNPLPASLKIVRKLSHFVPKFTKYGLLSTSCYCIWALSSIYLVADASVKNSTMFLFFALLTAYISTRVGIFIGRKIESSLDSIYEQSYINFSGADVKFVEQSATKIKSSKLRAVLNLTCTVALGVGSSLIASNLG